MSAINFKHLGLLLRGRMPKQVILEYTDQCNASCAQCGMRRENRYQRSTLNLEALKPSIDRMAQQGVDLLMITGGEPFLYLPQVTECIRYARQVGISHVMTGTNGFMFKRHAKLGFGDDVKQMTDTLLEAGLYSFWISLDSASADIHEKNRGLEDSVEGIAKALPIMHQQGLYPTAGMVLNRSLGGYVMPPTEEFEPERFYQVCRDSLRRFFQFAQQLGFTYVNVSYPGDWDNESEDVVYQVGSKDDMIHFSPAEKAVLYQALFDSVLEYRHQLRIFTPLVSLRSLIRHYQKQDDDGYACRGGIDIFFIDAKGMNTYPCGYRGQENLGRFDQLDFTSLDTSASCKACDIQCFRDPSELFGPYHDLTHRPFSLAKRFWRDREYAKLWLNDLRYYRACDYFDGRVAFKPQVLARFKGN